MASELRRDPVSLRWVIIAPDRSERPCILKTKDLGKEETFKDITNCPFCRGNEEMTPPEIFRLPKNSAKSSWKIRVVPNKYPAVGIEPEIKHFLFPDLFMTGYGAHEVLIDSPEHNLLIENQPDAQVCLILKGYRERLNDLYKDKLLRSVILFRNHGKEAGATLSHPHSQLIALPVIPFELKIELDGAKRHYEKERSCVWCDSLSGLLGLEYKIRDFTKGEIIKESFLEERVVLKNKNFVAFVPFAARYPYEIHIVPLFHSYSFGLISDKELLDLAWILKRVLKKISKLLNSPPYNYFLHTAPNIEADLRRGISSHWTTIKNDFHWHFEIIPMTNIAAGFEKGTGFFINTMKPEKAAKALRETEIDES